MDRITEAIAHFIGLFETTVEATRARDAYDEFHPRKADNPDLANLESQPVPFDAQYDLLGYDPTLGYVAPPPEWVVLHAREPFQFAPPEVPVEGAYGIARPVTPLPTANHVQGSPGVILPEVETLGSVANYISQKISLSDSDFFSVGGHGLDYAPGQASDAPLMELAGLASELSPIDDLGVPGSPAEMRDFVDEVADRLDAFAEGPHGENVHVERSDTIEGTFVNGQAVEEAPKFEDYYSFDEEASGGSVSASHADGDQNSIPSVRVETGDNVLVNDAVLKNVWTASPVMAVAGKYVEINAIIQINAWCDNDQLPAAVDGWVRDFSPTQAFNIATFERFNSFGDGSGEDSSYSGFPAYWNIKEIDGDLMIVNWIEQFTFMRDNDIGIVSSSGVTACISSGGNHAFNTVSLDEIGFGYDLIIIGGNVFDVNIIQQLNILYDDDAVDALAGFYTTGQGSIATSGNLLWNQAYIDNIGGAGRFDALPEHYRETMDKLAAGQDYLSHGVLTDEAFAGQGALRVLYIKGDLLNLQYVKQTNILGDSDKVALAMDEAIQHPEAEWSVSTGGNALVNNAAILDLDSLGKTYVGGEHYSDEVLIQADIISSDPDLGAQDPNALVNEAVAFLDDSMAEPGEQHHDVQTPYDADYQHPDGVHSLIG